MARTVNRDLTQGSPMKLLIGFALPLLGGFLFQQLYSFVDTAIVGRFLGYDALAAVGSTGAPQAQSRRQSAATAQSSRFIVMLLSLDSILS